MKSAPAKSCPSCAERYDADVLFCPRDGTPLANAKNPSFANAERDPYLGLELPGQIRLDHLIGIGSMGRVYRAFQGGIDRDVAVKILHRELSGNADLCARFHREAKVASRLVHPNVVQVLMTGALPKTADARAGGELYLVMEHLDGMSLLSALAAAAGDGGALPLPRALHIALQICDAVGEAHAQGIVHRDLKPENVMLVRRGADPDYVKVLDFGIARLDWAQGEQATQAGLIFGTAKYISPEGAEGQPVGPQADVYSIATILYQMLAGRTPFEGDSPVALLVQHTHAPPPELRSIARSSYVPAPLAGVIMQNLSKRPGERAANAQALGRDLVAAVRASGLYPEELASSPSLFGGSSFGSVKLASKERTRSHELSADLASRIGGVPASPSGHGSQPGVARADFAESTPLPKAPGGTLIGGAGSHHGAVDETSDDHEPYVPARPSDASATLPSARASERGGIAARSSAGRAVASPRAAQLDFDDAAPRSSQRANTPRAPSTPLGSTIQGTETSVESEPVASSPRRAIATRRARTTRLIAIAACLAVAVPAAIVGGRHLGGFGASASSDSIDATLDEARDCMRRRAWDAPADRNFKAIVAQGLSRWPDNARLLELRREAAALLVTDALGRKYAGDPAEALRLARLALDFNPQLTTAQHLAAELEAARSVDVAPAASGSATERAGTSVKPPRVKANPTPGAREPKGAEPKVAEPKPGAAQTAPSGQPGAVLPPTPPPLPPDHAPPAPASTGPWL